VTRRAPWKHCDVHGYHEKFTYCCVLCGRSSGCQHGAVVPGRHYPSSWGVLCQTERNKLRRSSKP
jgi:hypothetical protein